MRTKQRIYKIPYEDCLCIREDTIKYEQLKCFFSFYPKRIIFVEDSKKKVKGIISLADFTKGLAEKKIYVNENFKKIILCTDYIVEVEKFFIETTYLFIPVMDKENRLVEYWVRGNLSYEKLKIIPGKWLNINNPHLVKLVKTRSYTKIRVCMIDSLSKAVYDYFEYYGSYFNSVEKTKWNEIEKIKEDELLIINDKHKIYADVKAGISFLSELQMELEFNLLLKRCKDTGCNLYLISELTHENVTNLTQEERDRVDKRDRYLGWIPYLMEREQHAELLEQVLGRKKDMNEFIDSCLDYPLVVEKNQLCYLNEHSSKYCNVLQGNRITIGTPDYIKNTVYVAGNSFVFGPLVDDAHTIPSLLQQKMISEEKYKNYVVINEGIRGASSYESIKRLNNDVLKENDIVILFVDLKTFLWDMGKTIENFNSECFFGGGGYII